MIITIEVCDICGKQHDTREQLSWESIFTTVKIGLSYDGQNMPHAFERVCRTCRVVLTDAVNKAIEARRGVSYFALPTKKGIF